MVTKRRTTTKPQVSRSEKALLSEIERKHWPEIEAKLAKARADVAKGKVRKWDLDKFLSDLDKRRRTKHAAE